MEDSELAASDKGVIRAGVLQDAGPTSCRPSAPSPGNGSQRPENTTQKICQVRQGKGSEEAILLQLPVCVLKEEL